MCTWGVEVEGVKSKVAWGVVGVKSVEACALGVGPAHRDTVGLSQSNGKHQRLPEDGSLGLHLLEVSDSSSCTIAQSVNAQFINTVQITLRHLQKVLWGT